MSSRIVYRDKSGREILEADLARTSGSVDWSLVGGSDVPPRARELHAQARRAGESGQLKQALQLLSEARREAPNWPYPVYDAAYTHLLAGDDARALQEYEAVVKMAPRGFLTALTAAKYLRDEKAGRLKRGTYKQYLALEWLGDAAKKKAVLQRMTAQSPSFAPACKDLALLMPDADAQLWAIGRGLAQNPDGETRGFLLINKALILNRENSRDKAVRLLGDLALGPSAPLDVEHLARVPLANITQTGTPRQ